MTGAEKIGKRTYSLNGPECPHCGQRFIPDEAHYYDEQRYTEQDCDECEKTFKVEVYHSTSWTCEAIEPITPKG
jgi:transposase-like protein